MLLSGFSQNDPNAKAILDKVSAKNKTYKTIRVNFTINTTTSQSDSKSVQKGSLLLKGDKYQIALPNNETSFDGKDVYNYLPEVKEVNITKPQSKAKKSDDFFISNPKDIFRIYEKDFKYKFIKETTIEGKGIYEIDLYPIDLQKKYSRIRLQIDKNSNQISSIKTFLKDGQHYLITFTKFVTNQEIPDSAFTFDKTKHPDVEIIDLRF